jgi:hypothetical protein
MKKHKVIEFDDYITPDGKVYSFHNGVDRFLMSFEGDGMPPIEYITQQGPLQHGETPIDYRLQKRVLQYVVRRNGCNRYDYWEHRAELINMLRPNRQTPTTLAPGHLRKRIGRMIRQIDVFIEEGPVFAPRSTDDYDEYGITEALRFVAHDPIYYDPSMVTIAWAGLAANHLVFPITLVPFVGHPIDTGTDMMFGPNWFEDYLSLTYAGTWPAYPTIVITGPISGPIIQNVSTGKKIHLLYNISGGETVTISLPYGNKTVMNQNGVNLQGTLSDDSDLVDFAIEPDPTAANGVNYLLALGGAAIIGTTGVSIQYYTKYIGI